MGAALFVASAVAAMDHAAAGTPRSELLVLRGEDATTNLACALPMKPPNALRIAQPPGETEGAALGVHFFQAVSPPSSCRWTESSRVSNDERAVVVRELRGGESGRSIRRRSRNEESVRLVDILEGGGCPTDQLAGVSVQGTSDADYATITEGACKSRERGRGSGGPGAVGMGFRIGHADNQNSGGAREGVILRTHRKGHFRRQSATVVRRKRRASRRKKYRKATNRSGERNRSVDREKSGSRQRDGVLRGDAKDRKEGKPDIIRRGSRKRKRGASLDRRRAAKHTRTSSRETGHRRRAGNKRKPISGLDERSIGPDPRRRKRQKERPAKGAKRGGPDEVVHRVDDKDVDKAEHDHRKVRRIELRNGSSFILVSDKNVVSAVTAVVVHVGSAEDPEDVPGMAHFLEHMIHTGSKQFDVEGTYEKYVQDHGGSTNASTELSKTCYHFEVSPEALPKTLYILADHLRRPLFRKKYVNQELDSIDMEFQGQDGNFWTETISILRSIVNQAHPFSHFTEGNLQSLTANNVDLPARVREFYKKYYSAHLMTTTIVSNHSLDELESMSRKCFWKLKGFDVKFQAEESDQIPDLQWPGAHQVFHTGVGHDSSVSFIFDTGDKPTNARNYLSTMLGMNYRGSLSRMLESMTEVDNIILRDQEFTEFGHSAIWIRVGLGSRGMESVQNVGNLIFSFVHKLEEMNYPFWWVDQSVRYTKLNAKHSDVIPDEYVTWAQRAASDVAEAEDAKDFLMVDNLAAKSKAREWKKELNRLRSENLVVIMPRGMQLAKCTNSGKFTTAKYGHDEIDKDMLSEWNQYRSGDLKHPNWDSFAVPGDYTFIPRNFKLKKLEGKAVKVPKKVEIGDSSLAGKLTVYCKQDTVRKVPRTALVARITIPAIGETKADAVSLLVFAKMLENAFEGEVLSAPDIDTTVLFSPEAPGVLTMTIESFSDISDALVKCICKIMAEARAFSSVDEAGALKAIMSDLSIPSAQRPRQRFDTFATKNGVDRQVVRDYHMFGSSNMDKYNIKVVSDEEIAKAFNDTSLRAPRVKNNLFEKAHVELVAIGNITPSEALRLGKAAVTCLGIKQSTPPREDVDVAFDFDRVKSPNGKPLRLRLTLHDEEATGIFVVMGKRSPELSAFTDVVGAYISQNFEHFVRNNGVPLAYAYDSLSTDDPIPSVGWNISSQYESSSVISALEAFGHKFFKGIARKSKKWFEKMKHERMETEKLSSAGGAESTFGESTNYDEQLQRRLVPFRTRSPKLIALKRLTHKRFVEIAGQYMNRPWVLVASGGFGPSEVYRGKLPEPPEPTEWTSIGDGQDWLREHGGDERESTLSSTRKGDPLRAAMLEKAFKLADEDALGSLAQESVCARHTEHHGFAGEPAIFGGG